MYGGFVMMTQSWVGIYQVLAGANNRAIAPLLVIKVVQYKAHICQFDD